MKPGLFAVVALVGVAALVGSVTRQGTAEPAAANGSGPAPRLANGRIDFSGIWLGGGPIANIADGLPAGETLPLLPAARAILDARQSREDPQAHCLPSGVPRTAPYPWRIVQTPTHIFFLFEANIHSYRQIFMDGRPHPPDPDPTWYGHSIGRFDGDTLVVDTVGFNDRFWFDFKGHPHTERLHIVERYSRTSAGRWSIASRLTIREPTSGRSRSRSPPGRPPGWS